MDNHSYNEMSDPTETEGYWGRLLGGLFLGCLVGAVLMLLLAPQSGKKTRAKLQRQSHDLREQTSDVLGEAIDLARDKAKKITHDVGEQAEKLEQRGQAMLAGQK